MIANADITIYNQRMNPVTKLTEYVRTQIKNVSWYTEQKTSVDQNGVHSADIYKVRIPIESAPPPTYVDCDEWRRLNDTSDYWTLQQGDLFVRGLITDDIEKASDLLKKYAYAAKINSFSDNRRGSLPHWRIGGAS